MWWLLKQKNMSNTMRKKKNTKNYSSQAQAPVMSEQQKTCKQNSNAGCEPLKQQEKNMHHLNVLNSAVTTISQRGNEYGDIHPNFVRAATIASCLLDKKLTAFDVAAVMMAVKMARLTHNRDHEDSWVDLTAYTAFAAQFAAPHTSDFNDVITASVEAELTRQMKENPV
jgi:Domain of unknown function (DUF6378)